MKLVRGSRSFRNEEKGNLDFFDIESDFHCQQKKGLCQSACAKGRTGLFLAGSAFIVSPSKKTTPRHAQTDGH
jgi:hypothetical protein